MASIWVLAPLLLGLLHSSVAAEPPPRATDTNGKLARAEAAFAAYQSIGEWSGTFLFKELDTDAKGEAKVVETDRIRFYALYPQWRVEQEFLENGKVKSLTIEVFDGQRNWVYQERNGGSLRRGMINNREDYAHPAWVPTHPDLVIPAQEVRHIVMGGTDRRGVEFTYYAGTPAGAPADTEAFVGLGKDGWLGWSALLLDPARQYAPVEIWGGYGSKPGNSRAVFSSWKQDEKGRPYATEMVDRLGSPSDGLVVTYSVSVEQFGRTVNPKLVRGITFPDQTAVTMDHQPDSRYVVGEPKP